MRAGRQAGASVRTRFGGGYGLYVDLHVLVDGEMSVTDSHDIADSVHLDEEATIEPDKGAFGGLTVATLNAENKKKFRVLEELETILVTD